MCRVCLETHCTELNPFIAPCQCKGGVQYIHLACVKYWLNSKRISMERVAIKSYYWEELQCEICKGLFELKTEINGEIVNLLEYDRPDAPYMVIESDLLSSQVK